MISEDDADQEARALEQVLAAYSSYQRFALQEYYEPRFKKWQSLSSHQRELVPWYGRYLNLLKDAIGCNALFLSEVVTFAKSMIGIQTCVEDWPPPSRMDLEKTVSMITQVYREWSEECEVERSLLLHRVLKRLKLQCDNPTCTRVLIPGAGTGRLMADLVKKGYYCESNEFSYHMLVMSMYILNGGLQKGQKTIYPFIHTFSHWKSRKGHLRSVAIPDFDIYSELGENDHMSMSSGSFIDCYGPNEKIRASNTYSVSPRMKLIRAEMESAVSVVITNFFIDTSSNILDYLETIEHVLVPGGLWINFGPLLYHFECDDQVETTFEVDLYTGEKTELCEYVPLKGLELTADDILEVSEMKLNFKCLAKEFGIECGYGRPASGFSYMCNYWVLQKQETYETKILRQIIEP
ncbi:related to UPF0586 protein YNL092W [Zygosaccharomyces bailii]|nr:related to UPF0586 protein YNL092W [Zygosaccharomyces bailii]